MNFSNKAAEFFNNGYCCSEAVLLQVAENYSIDVSSVLQLASGFCGGIAHTNSLCGAYSGGVLALGLKLGSSNPKGDKVLLYEAIHELRSNFIRKYNSDICSGVCGCDKSTQEGNKQFEDMNKKPFCTEVVGFAADFVSELIIKYEDSDKTLETE